MNLDTLTIATLCDMILGDHAPIRDCDTLVRTVGIKLRALHDAKVLISKIYNNNENVSKEIMEWIKTHE